MSPSVTYWNRLEPSPRSNDLVPALAAGVADGLWTLTRQWQLSEFEGADAGSPAWIEIDSTTRRLTAWRAGDAGGPIETGIPLENVIGERLPFDLAARIDLGQLFESMLRAENLTAAVAILRGTYPITAAAAEGETDEAVRLRALGAGRVIDGAALYHDAVAAAPDNDPVAVLMQQYVKLVAGYFGGQPGASSPAWNPKRLDYELDVSAGDAGGFEVRPADDGEITWDSFSSSAFLSEPDAHPPRQERVTYLPARVRFRGAPSGPWWNFDHAALDAGAIDAERRDVAKLVLADILLAQGDDWYVVPIDQEIGTVVHLDAVCVRDVFGLLTFVPPAAGDHGPWSMFSTSGPSSLLGLLVPADCGAANLYGRMIEEVRFVRDDMMNMVWAIEERIEGAAPPAAGGPDLSRFGEAMPRYLLRTAVPQQRIPFVPAVRGVNDGALLERVGNGATRILKAAPAIAEEELRRSGLRVRRVPARCRGAHGETFVRIAYIKDFTPPTDSPAPRFDALVPGSGSADLALPVTGPVAFIQSSFSTHGDFEVIVPLQRAGLAGYSRDNDADGFPWRSPAIIASEEGKFEAVSMIQSTFGNIEIVSRIGDRLAHFWRDATQEWHGPNGFATGIAGTLSLIQSRLGSTGNFEVAAPLAAGGIAHFWRDNHTFDWSGANVFAQNAGRVDDVCLIQGSFGGNLELVARIGARLAHFWRDGVSQQWNGPTMFAAGVSGTPSFIQQSNGNFEIVAPLAAGGLGHFSRDNAAPGLPWSGPVPFGGGTFTAAALIQSNFGGNLEVVALTAGGLLVHFWRESGQLLPWNGPNAISS